jgi:hypothetical protein
MFVIDTDLQGEALREANIKEPLEEPSGFALALRDWPQATPSRHSNRHCANGRFRVAEPPPEQSPDEDGERRLVGNGRVLCLPGTSFTAS